MYAVIKSGGKQFKVNKDTELKVEALNVEPGSEIEFKEVLLVHDNKHLKVGTPYVENAVVKAEVVEQRKGPKVLVFKKKPRKGFKCLRGHRQHYSVVKIKEIVSGG